MGKNTDRSFLFFFRGICCLVFAYSHVKEASTGIIRTMHTQKKRQGGRRGRGGEGRETEMEQKRGEGERRWSNKDGGKKRSMPPIPTDLRDHSLPLSFRPFFAFFPPFLFPVFLPCNSPSPRLVTLPVPPVSGFAGFVGMRERSFHPSSSTSFATRSQPEPTDFLFHCFRPDARAYLSLQLLPRMPFLPPSKYYTSSSWFLTVRVLQINLP